MLCPKCGAEVGDAIKLCDRCERLNRFQDSQEEIEGVVEGGAGGLSGSDATEEFSESETQSSDPELDTALPAGFWLRFVAYIFDASFTLVLTHIFQNTIFSLLGLSITEFTEVARKPEQVIAALTSGIVLSLVLSFAGYIIIHLLYYALFESSQRQATPGKIILGLRVSDQAGEPLSFAKAALRHLASGVSIATFGVGFILAGFGERKQSLHDRISGSQVLRVKQRSAVELVASVLGAVIFAVVCQAITASKTVANIEGVTVPVVESVPTINEQPISRRDGGSLTYDDHVVSLKSTRVFFSPEDSVLEVRFYPADGEQRHEADYIATVVIGLRSGELVLDKKSVMACFIRILDGGKEIEVPCDGAMTDALTSSGNTNYLTGDLSSNLPIVGSFQGSAQLIQNGSEPQREFRWLLEFNAIAQDRDAFDKENRIVGERDVSYSLALLDRVRETVTLAFFKDELTEQDIRLIREENSASVVRDNPPIIQAVVKFKPQTKVLHSDNIESCIVRYEELPESTLLEVSKEIGACDIRGELSEAAKITGEMRGSSSVSSEQFAGLLSWKVPVETVLVDTDVGESLSSAGGEQPVRGYVKAGSEAVEFKSAVGLYYRKSDRLEIGFYALELNDSDRKVIQQNRSFITPVRDRRANLILSIRFAPGATVADLPKIIETNVYVVRDVFGGFYFPGQYERQSIARTRTQLSSGELRRFGGDLKGGSNVVGLLKGEEVLAPIATTFSWKVDFSVPLLEVE